MNFMKHTQFSEQGAAKIFARSRVFCSLAGHAGFAFNCLRASSHGVCSKRISRNGHGSGLQPDFA